MEQGPYEREVNRESAAIQRAAHADLMAERDRLAARLAKVTKERDDLLWAVHQVEAIVSEHERLLRLADTDE